MTDYTLSKFVAELKNKLGVSSEKTIPELTQDILNSFGKEIPEITITNIAQRDYESIVLPSGIEKIRDYAFTNHGGLSSITIPNSVKSIGTRAFYNCSSLSDIYCEFPKDSVSGAPWGATNAKIHYT